MQSIESKEYLERVIKLQAQHKELLKIESVLVGDNIVPSDFAEKYVEIRNKFYQEYKELFRS